MPLFQEQAMQVAMVCAGFSADYADQIRRAMAPFKFTGGVSHFQEKLINGMIGNGYEQAFAERTCSRSKASAATVSWKAMPPVLR